MKMKEITELSTDELLTKRRDLRQERLHLRLQQQTPARTAKQVALLRRDVAQFKQTKRSARRLARRVISGAQDGNHLNHRRYRRTSPRFL
jgi:ribosomal protein L29